MTLKNCQESPTDSIKHLQMMKYQSCNSLKREIDKATVLLMAIPSLPVTLEKAINDRAIAIKVTGEILIKAVLLAMIVGDIGNQQDKILKSENLSKITTLCNEYKIEFSAVRQLSELEIEIIELIQENFRGEQ